jgi:hypothetical protein
VLLTAAYCGWLMLGKRWSAALLYATACLPAALWYLYVAAHTPGIGYPERFIPLASIVGSLAHPQPYPAGTPLVEVIQAADLLALAGALAAFGMAALLAVRQRPLSSHALAAACFALLGIFSQRPDQWRQVFDFGRVYTPLLLLLAAQALRRRRYYWLVPWALMMPRVAIQFAPQMEKLAAALVR